MPEKPARPPREAHSSLGVSLPLREKVRLHELAELRNVSLSTLIRTAIEKTYPPEQTLLHGSPRKLRDHG